MAKIKKSAVSEVSNVNEVTETAPVTEFIEVTQLPTETVPAESDATVAPAAPAEPKPEGKIKQILDLHKAGKTNKEIVEAGFNKTTVSIQVARYKKKLEAEAATAASGTVTEAPAVAEA